MTFVDGTARRISSSVLSPSSAPSGEGGSPRSSVTRSGPAWRRLARTSKRSPAKTRVYSSLSSYLSSVLIDSSSSTMRSVGSVMSHRVSRRRGLELWSDVNGGILGHRQHHTERRARAFARNDGDAAAMPLNDLSRLVETDAPAAILGSRERLEEQFTDEFLGHATAGVGHRHDGHAVAGLDANGDAAFTVDRFDSVREEILKNTEKCIRVAGDRRCDLDVADETDSRMVTQWAGRLVHQLEQVDGLEMQTRCISGRGKAGEQTLHSVHGAGQCLHAVPLELRVVEVPEKGSGQPRQRRDRVLHIVGHDRREVVEGSRFACPRQRFGDGRRGSGAGGELPECRHEHEVLGTVRYPGPLGTDENEAGQVASPRERRRNGSFAENRHRVRHP